MLKQRGNLILNIILGIAQITQAPAFFWEK